VNPYIGSVIFIAILGGIVFHLLRTRKAIPAFSIQELVTVALFCSLLYIAILPFKFGLSRIPIIQSFFFSMPYSTGRDGDPHHLRPQSPLTDDLQRRKSFVVALRPPGEFRSGIVFSRH
jgi:hypothetical protein